MYRELVLTRVTNKHTHTQNTFGNYLAVKKQVLLIRH